MKVLMLHQVQTGEMGDLGIEYREIKGAPIERERQGCDLLFL